MTTGCCRKELSPAPRSFVGRAMPASCRGIPAERGWHWSSRPVAGVGQGSLLACASGSIITRGDVLPDLSGIREDFRLRDRSRFGGRRRSLLGVGVGFPWHGLT